MKRFVPIIALPLLLAGCPALTGTSSSAATVQQVCIAATPVLVAGAASTNPQASAIAADGNAFCGPLLAGSTPPTADTNSASWVTGLIGALAPLLIGAL